MAESDDRVGSVERHLPGALSDFKPCPSSVDLTIPLTSCAQENHDQARSISRYASDLPEFRSLSGKLLAMHLASLCGTVYVYQGKPRSIPKLLNRYRGHADSISRALSFFRPGQELGQINVSSDWLIEEFKDVGSKNLFNDHQVSLPITYERESASEPPLLSSVRRPNVEQSKESRTST